MVSAMKKTHYILCQCIICVLFQILVNIYLLLHFNRYKYTRDVNIVS